MPKLHYDHSNTSFLERFAVLMGIVVAAALSAHAVTYLAVEYLEPVTAVWAISLFVSMNYLVAAWNRWGPWAGSQSDTKSSSGGSDR